MFQVAALSWFTRRPITIRACNCLAKSNFFTTCEAPVWDPVCYTQSMSIKSFDHSLFYQSQLSTSISRNVTRVRTHSIKNNFSNHTKTYTLHLWWLLTQYITLTRLFILIVSKSICEKIAFEERLKSYGLRFTFVSFQVLIPPAPIGGRKERGGVGKGKKREILGRRLPENGGQKNVRQL